MCLSGSANATAWLSPNKGIRLRTKKNTPPKNVVNVCSNCLVPAAAMITRRRSATPGRPGGNPEMIKVEHYTTAAPLAEDACL